MTEVRPYRQALRPDEAMTEIRKGAGTHYDPRMVEALEGVLACGDG
jgi:putative two-component system response regulator